MTAPVLRLEGVRFTRTEGFRLGPLDLDLSSGEILAVLGPNGAGKTTLLELATGVLRTEGGSISLFGEDPSRRRRTWVAQRVAVVPQRATFPFALRVEEVVSQGRWPHLRGLRLGGRADREIVASAMERTRLTELADRDVRTLSGGEVQRVLIAKALAQQPKLLLLDEPTASLDPGHVLRVLGPVVEEAAAGKLSLLLASHDLTLAGAVAGRVLLLNEGRAEGLGAPSEILTEERLRRVYGAPLSVDPHPATGRPRVWLDFRGEEPSGSESSGA